MVEGKRKKIDRKKSTFIERAQDVAYYTLGSGRCAAHFVDALKVKVWRKESEMKFAGKRRV